jgi:hypothetical protein
VTSSIQTEQHEKLSSPGKSKWGRKLSNAVYLITFVFVLAFLWLSFASHFMD